MVDIENYISRLIDLLLDRFGSRLLYVGLQGSYFRAEATDSSDIDIMVILDRLHISDLDSYRSIILSLEEPDKSCGFICSKADMANWNPCEIGHLLHSTKDCYGMLSRFIPPFTEHDIRNFVKLSLNNTYHDICHRYIHSGRDDSMAKLPDSYKGVFFILQNLYYLEHGEYIQTKAALLPLLTGKNQAVLERSIELSKGRLHDFSESFELLFTWCQDTMKSL